MKELIRRINAAKYFSKMLSRSMYTNDFLCDLSQEDRKKIWDALNEINEVIYVNGKSRIGQIVWEEKIR